MLSYRDFVSSLPRRPAIVAHRGHWRVAPENSLAAIARAADAGYEIVEIDVQRSSDGRLFLMHDDMLTRMAGRADRAQALTLAELTETRLRARDGLGDPDPTGHRIPTLEDALEVAKGRVYLDVDVKHAENLDAAGAAIAATGMNDFVDIKVRVQTTEDCERLRDLEQRYGIMVMPMTRFSADTAPHLIAMLAGLDARIVETEFDHIDTLAKHAADFDAAGITRWVNTLTPVCCCGFSDEAALRDPDAVWGALRDAGTGIFQTDEPEALDRWRRSC